MKKSTIGIIVTAVIMIVIGICLCIGGVAAAGGIKEAKDAIFRSDIDLSHVYSFEVDEDGVDLDFGRKNYDTIHHSEEPHKTEHHSSGITKKTQDLVCNSAMYGAEIVKGLELEIGAAKVEFVNDSSVGEITVQTKDTFEIYVRNEVLYIKSQNVMKKNEIQLEIPRNVVFENVEIKGNACEITIPYLETKEFDVEADAGVVQIEELVADKAEFEVGAGEIIVNDGKVQICDVNVGMGNFEYSGIVTRRGDVECGMGNAEFYLDASEKDYNYKIDCATGNVAIGNSTYGGLSVEKKVNNNADAMIEIDCAVGNVTIGF